MRGLTHILFLWLATHVVYFPSQYILSECWRAWRLTAVAQRKCAFALARQAAVRKSHSLHSWVAYVIRQRHTPQKTVMAIEHWSHKCLQKTWKKWNWTLRSWRMSEKEEASLSIVAHNHWGMYMIKSFFHLWIQWIKSYARPKKRKFAAVQAHINSMTCKQALAAWRCLVHVRWVRRMKYEEAIIQDTLWSRKRTMARCALLLSISKFMVCTPGWILGGLRECDANLSLLCILRWFFVIVSNSHVTTALWFFAFGP